MTGAPPLLIEFVPRTSIYREPDLISALPVVRNGPPGTFIVFHDGLKVSLPTDQIVFTDDTAGAARVGFGGMTFTGMEGGRLIFQRFRDLLPEEQLSPARSWTMTLQPQWVLSVYVDGRPVWPRDSPVRS